MSNEIKRFNHGVCEYPGGIFSEMNQEADGDYVLFSDHEAEVARLRAEVEKCLKDAKRWKHARKLLTIDDIAERQRTLEEWNYLISEDECKRADEAIDAAMGASA